MTTRPPEWRLLKAGDVLLGTQYGLNLPSSNGGNTRIVGMKDLNGGLVHDIDLARVQMSEKDAEPFLLHSGDLLLNRTNSPDLVGKIGYVAKPIKAVFASYLVRLVPDPTIINSKFLAYWLASSRGQEEIKPLITRGVSQANINPTTFCRHVQIPVPSIAEQQRVVDILSTWDHTLERLSRQIARKKQFFSLLRDSLVDGTRHLSRRNKPWPIVALGALGDFLKGCGLTKADMTEDGVPCLRYAEIYTSYGDVTVALHSRATASAARTAFSLLRDDIIFAASGETAEEIGKAVAYLGNDNAVVGGDAIVFRNHGQSASFLARTLNGSEIQKQKSRLGHGHSVVHIHASSLAAIKIRLPPLGEQWAIVEVLDDTEREINALKTERASLEKQQDALAAQLLTGRLRVRGAARAALAG